MTDLELGAKTDWSRYSVTAIEEENKGLSMGLELVDLASWLVCLGDTTASTSLVSG